MDKRIENLTRNILKYYHVCESNKRLLLKYLEQDNEEGIKAVARGNINWLYRNDLIDEVSEIIDLGDGRFECVLNDGFVSSYGNVRDYHITVSVYNEPHMRFITLYNKHGNGLATKQISKTSNEWWFRYWIDRDADVLYHYRDGVTQIKHNYFADWHDSIGGTGSVDGEYQTPMDNYQELLEMTYDELQKFISSIPHPSKMPLPANWEVLPRRTAWIRI